MQNVTAVRTSVLPPYAAHLRVYEPLAAYPRPERERWQAYAAAPGSEPRGPGEPVAVAALEEQRAALAELAARTPRALPERESAEGFVRSVDGVTYVCPWATRLRSWQALEELGVELPRVLLDTVLPPAVRAAALADRERWLAEHPDARPWILTSRWEVPMPWFVPFGEEDRRFVPAGAATGPAGRPAPAALFYLTPMAQARRRVARGLRALREWAPGEVLGRPVEQVGRWLEEFHPRSLVELDYCGLVHLLGPEWLAAEHSVAEIGGAVAAVRAGDGAAAVRAYRSVAERWERVRALRQAS